MFSDLSVLFYQLFGGFQLTFLHVANLHYISIYPVAPPPLSVCNRIREERMRDKGHAYVRYIQNHLYSIMWRIVEEDSFWRKRSYKSNFNPKQSNGGEDGGWEGGGGGGEQ